MQRLCNKAMSVSECKPAKLVVQPWQRDGSVCRNKRYWREDRACQAFPQTTSPFPLLTSHLPAPTWMITA